MSKDNLELWNSVEKTNPNYTKKAKVGGNSITAIDPQYQIKQATKQFGIYGKDWGFKDIELDYSLVSKTFEMDKTEGSYPNLKVVGKQDSPMGLVVFKAIFFFPNGEFPIINSIDLFTSNKRNKVDDNFAKKVETDTLTKALSKLGFSADIFLGKYDNVKYFNEVKKEFAEDLTKEELKELEEKVKKEEDLNELTNIYNSDIRFRVNPYVTKLLTDRRIELTDKNN